MLMEKIHHEDTKTRRHEDTKSLFSRVSPEVKPRGGSGAPWSSPCFQSGRLLPIFPPQMTTAYWPQRAQRGRQQVSSFSLCPLCSLWLHFLEFQPRCFPFALFAVPCGSA